MPPPRIPIATYRVQFNRHFRFSDAQAIVPYLAALGITDLYSSPLWQAEPGSLHGYDVTDYSRVNPELGSEAELEVLLETLKQHGMGLVMDIVANHMSIAAPFNPWWQDVLENGPSSPCARFFDIDWRPPKEDLANKILVPLLGEQYGKVLENGELRLVFESGGFCVVYYSQRWPIGAETWPIVLKPILERIRSPLGADHSDFLELGGIITTLEHLPRRTEVESESIVHRRRETAAVKRRLSDLVEINPIVRHALQETVAEFNGTPGDPGSFDRLEALLSEQAYRLCFWRVATDEINYRRFFDVNELAAVRVEVPEVFEAVHEIPLRLLSRGVVSGFRIDHPDGLFDPEQYFRNLQSASAKVRSAEHTMATRAAAVNPDRSCYLVVEKILCRGERLRKDWAVHGTTGYEFLNDVNRLFVEPTGQESLRDMYRQLTGVASRFSDLRYESKKLILDVSMSSELHVLARRLDRVSEQHRWSRDFTLWSLQKALGEIIACFPVYRTYIQLEDSEVSEEDRRHIMAAVREAKWRNPATSESIFDFIASVLLLDDPEGLSDDHRLERRHFVMRFQQITGPVMAKGLEDTAFYRAYPLASLYEVGGDPERFSISVEEFHRHNKDRRKNWPYSMSATSTHDTKRSEDVRARINVLSEIPEQWQRAIRRWSLLNRTKKIEIDGADVPDPNEEYLLYQTLVGTWPWEAPNRDIYGRFVERIQQYMEKALREAKLHTSWINPNEEYEQAVRAFVERVLDPSEENRFLTDFQRFHNRIAFAGMGNCLSQTLLKIASPGVPDFYQGTELWDFRLVDPDNRQPVDFEQRMKWLDELRSQERHGPLAMVRWLLEHWRDGRIKLYVTYKALNFRRQHRDLFLEGAYLPIRAVGEKRRHLCSFARHRGRDWVLIAVPRWLMRLGVGARPPVGRSVLGTTALRLPSKAPFHWRNIFTGESVVASISDHQDKVIAAESVFRRFPVALLTAEGSEG